MNWFSRTGAGAVLGLLLLVNGCQQSARRADLVILNGPEPESLDPAIFTGQADGRVGLALFEGLTRYDPVTAKGVPGLASSWEISADQKTYTFHLRTNAFWSPGEPITADDLVYSWRRVLNPVTASEYAGQLYYVKNGEAYNTNGLADPDQVGVHALDRYTVRVDLVDPTPFFIDLCAFPTLSVVPRRTIERYGDHWLAARPLPASGAYQLDVWRPNNRIRVRKNPFYWDASNTSIEVIDLLPCTVAVTALNFYETGQADILWDKELVPPELADILMQRPDFHRFDYLGTYFYRYNVTRKPFDDARVRKALALALDKARLVQKLLKSGEKPASQYVPLGIPGYESPRGLGYDPEEARRLLAEAGYPGGHGFPPFHYLFNSLKIHEKIAVEMQQMWKQELGIQVELRQLEWKTFLAAQGKLDYDLCRASWIGDYNDPNTFLDMFMSNNGNNRTGWKNPRYDQLMRQANSQTNTEARAQLLRKAESLLIEEELPIVPIYLYAGLECYDSSRLAGIYSNLRSEHPLRSIRKLNSTAGPAAAPVQAASFRP